MLNMPSPVPIFACVIFLLCVSTSAGRRCYPSNLESVNPVFDSSPVTTLNSGGHNTTVFPSLAFGCAMAVSHVSIVISNADVLCEMETGLVRFGVEFWRDLGGAHVLEARHTAVGTADEIKRQCTGDTLSETAGLTYLNFRVEKTTSTSQAIVYPGYVLGVRIPLRLSLWPDAAKSDMPPAEIMNVSLVYQKTLQSALYLAESASDPVALSSTAHLKSWLIYLAPRIGFLADVSSISSDEDGSTETQSVWQLPTIFVFIVLVFLGILAILVLLGLMIRARFQVCSKPAEEKDGNCYYSYPRALASGRPPTQVVPMQSPESASNPEPYIFPKPPSAAYVNVRTPVQRATHFTARASTKPPPPQISRPDVISGHDRVFRTRSSPGNFSTSIPNGRTAKVASTASSNEPVDDDPVYEDTSFVDADSSSVGTAAGREDYLNTAPRPPHGKPKVLFPFKFHWPRQLNGSASTDREYI